MWNKSASQIGDTFIPPCTFSEDPPLSPCLSSGLITVSSENLYWNPEHPPPSTSSLRNSDPSVDFQKPLKCRKESQECQARRKKGGPKRKSPHSPHHHPLPRDRLLTWTQLSVSGSALRQQGLEDDIRSARGPREAVRILLRKGGG